MRILTDIELRRNYKEVKGVTSPLDTTESLNVSEISEKGGKFVYKTKDGEKEIKVEAGLGKVVIALSKEDWVDNGQGKFTYTITPAMLNLAPSVTYGIEMQVFNYNIMMWQRVAVTPNIDQEGNIIITSLSRLECNIIVTSGLILPPPKPEPPKPSPNKIYGVDQVGRENPLDLPRTDDAVGMTYSLNGNIYSSDFDNAVIYKDIKEVTDNKGNVFIRVPKFYHKYTLNSDGTYKVQISNSKVDDSWVTCFINAGKEIPYMDIGKYEASGSGTLKSVSGVAPLVNTTISTFRTYAKNVGTGYHQFDIWNYEVLKLLFLVEFATTNSQSIMYGYANGNSSAINTGSCDGIITGSPVSVTNGKHGCTYRGIENPWGNINKWTDGINFQDANVYICDDISKYQSDLFSSPYVLSGTRATTSNYISEMEPTSNGIMVPTKLRGSETTYYCDDYYTGGRVLDVGGAWSLTGSAGLWRWRGNRGSSLPDSSIGGRLCRKPIAGTNFD